MDYWIGVNGLYYEGDRVYLLDQPCAPKPSAFHVFTGVVSLDPAICWRAMTQAEIDAIKDRVAAEIVNGTITVYDVLKAFALVVLDEVNLLRGQHALAPRTAAQLKTAIINKLPNP